MKINNYLDTVNLLKDLGNEYSKQVRSNLIYTERENLKKIVNYLSIDYRKNWKIINNKSEEFNPIVVDLNYKDYSQPYFKIIIDNDHKFDKEYIVDHNLWNTQHFEVFDHFSSSDQLNSKYGTIVLFTEPLRDLINYFENFDYKSNNISEEYIGYYNTLIESYSFFFRTIIDRMTVTAGNLDFKISNELDIWLDINDYVAYINIYNLLKEKYGVKARKYFKNVLMHHLRNCYIYKESIDMDKVNQVFNKLIENLIYCFITVRNDKYFSIDMQEACIRNMLKG